MPTKPFLPGNKFAKGGKRAGAGDKSKEEKAFRAKVAEAVEAQVKLKLETLTAHYVNRAFNDDKVLMHLMDAYISKAKAEIEVSGVKIMRIIAPRYMHDD